MSSNCGDSIFLFLGLCHCKRLLSVNILDFLCHCGSTLSDPWHLLFSRRWGFYSQQLNTRETPLTCQDDKSDRWHHTTILGVPQDYLWTRYVTEWRKWTFSTPSLSRLQDHLSETSHVESSPQGVSSSSNCDPHLHTWVSHCDHCSGSSEVSGELPNSLFTSQSTNSFSPNTQKGFAWNSALDWR